MRCCMLINLRSLGPCKHIVWISTYSGVRERVNFLKTKLYYFNQQKGNKIYTRYL